MAAIRVIRTVLLRIFFFVLKELPEDVFSGDSTFAEHKLSTLFLVLVSLICSEVIMTEGQYKIFCSILFNKIFCSIYSVFTSFYDLFKKH